MGVLYDMKLFFLGQKKLVIQEDMEKLKDTYLYLAGELDNDFYASFYELCTESILADAYEIFLETDTEYNYFKQHLWEMDSKKGQRFFKCMAIYHTITILKKKRKLLDKDEMMEAMFAVYEFNETEQKLADILYEIACFNQAGFLDVFSRFVAGYLFSGKKLSPFSLAFIENFCYNSFNNFMAAFTKYSSVKNRLQKAAR